jgi:Na+/melibiose symporter-like transporter
MVYVHLALLWIIILGIGVSLLTQRHVLLYIAADGRMEDRYIEWSSYLQTYFGFTIHPALTPRQEADLKCHGNGDSNDEKATTPRPLPVWITSFSSLPNLAIPVSYFCIGVALQLLRTPLIVYFITDLNATPAQVNVLFTVMAVPWCFKVFFGFASDCFPISGYRRKPYFTIGWMTYIVSNLLLAAWPFSATPSIGVCVGLVITQTTGCWRLYPSYVS